ncbi:hypothetical protein MMC18_006286 [Xylographa bjoerkii]|nr:hypothetical protein [Xylographa bjoerkii]
MSHEKPHFLARKFQDFQRQLAKPHLCTLCKDEPIFSGIRKLADHAHVMHPTVIKDGRECTAWKQYVADAVSRETKQKRSINAGQPTSYDSLQASEPSSRKPRMFSREDGKVESLNGQSISAPLALESLSPLANSQEHEFHRSKRAAAVGSGLSDQLTEKGEYNTLQRKRRAKDPEFDRGAAASIDQRQKLFDPSNDRSQFRSNLHKPREIDGKLRSHRLYDPRLYVFKPWRPERSEEPLLQEHRTNMLDSDMEPEPEPELLLQPEIRPISHEQLVVEVKGIYAGLVMVEAKCINIDDKHCLAAQERTSSTHKIKHNPEQWQALIALHKTLLHEHHDFFLASQHPLASPALSRLAAKYSMPARMWRHGIYAFLEVLRHRLPESLDHMLAFIYIAYSMMALLYETVPTFEDTWIECLGDLDRYRMAIEDDDIRDREVWSGVARFWYGKAANKSPRVGRLYHHLSILARPYTLQQLSLYTRSLTRIVPFESAKGSITTLFNPILDGWDSTYHRPSSIETISKKSRELRDYYIGRMTANFKEQGIFAAISHTSSMLEYGIARVEGASRFPWRVAFEEILSYKGKTEILWTRLATLLNSLTNTEAMTSKVLGEQFPQPEEAIGRPLPEDFGMRGQLWSQSLFPDMWFLDSTTTAKVDIASEAKIASIRKPFYQPETASHLSTISSYGLRHKRSRPNRACYIALLAILAGPILAINPVSDTVSTPTLHLGSEPCTTAASHTSELPQDVLPGTLNSPPEQLWVTTATASPTSAAASNFVPEPLNASNPDLADELPVPNVTSLSQWGFPILCIIILISFWQVAKIAQWEPIHVSGTLAVVAWWLWLYLKRDPAISPWFSWPIWAVGVVTLVAYGRCGFEDYKLSHSHAFLSLATAVPLAIAAARFVPDLQDDYLTALPPCFGISLSFYIFAVPATTSVWGTTARYMHEVAGRLRVPWHSADNDSSSGGRNSFNRRSRRPRQLEDVLPRFRGRSLPTLNRDR